MRDPRAQRAGVLGVVFGIFVALGGVGAGIYFGMIRPAIEAGAQIVVPIRFIVVSIAMLTLVGLFAIYRLSKWDRRPPNDRW
jgi:hypothetical protein